MSDTPRTDSMEDTCGPGEIERFANFARDLEREIAACRAEVATTDAGLELLREIQARGLCFEDAELSQRVARFLDGLPMNNSRSQEG
jgi:hypothetical protein